VFGAGAVLIWPEGGRYLQPHEVILIIQASLARSILRLQPLPSYDRQQHAAFVDALVDRFSEITSRLNCIHYP
jgi:hypothetical protein